MTWRQAALALSLPLVALAPVLSRSVSAAPRLSADVTVAKVVTRTHLEQGGDVSVDSRSISVIVSHTTDLRSHESIDVSWSGAHPTGGIAADVNSGDARNQEYPVVVIECRGSDTDATPLDPTTCWTATAGERFQDSLNTAFPPWRLDRYATPAAREAVVGAPAGRPAACFGASPSEYWVPFIAANGTQYSGGTGGCAGQAPESANVGGLNLPSNTTYGITRADGTGSTGFDVWTADDNASLGCNENVACTLVVVPIMGISCDVAGAGLPPQDQDGPDNATDDAALCESTGRYAPGTVATPAVHPDVAVSGSLWWAASNWRNRIAVPLTFAVSTHACDVIDSSTSELDIYGSELMTQAMLQWAPPFCLDHGLFRLKHVQTPEPQARSLLANGGVTAVFTADVSHPPSPAPVIAPVAVTGFAISFSIDDAQNNPVSRLEVTPRLLAKLLTESYPAINAMKTEYAALAQNPLNVSLDPEFIALNPGITQGVPASQSASALLALSSDSDVMAALTAYIDADPEARAWLDGTPDPWGMVVNPNYRGIALPTASWPLLDSFEPPLLYASDTNDCLTTDPVPYLPLVAAPVGRLSTIAFDMQFSLANAQTVCKQITEGSREGEKLVAIGRQTPGFRFMLGVTSLADAQRYGLRTASLQTNVAANAPVPLTSDAGRTFVAPTDDTLRNAAQLLTLDPTTNSWPIPYDRFRADATAANAYPGTMVVYLEVPVSALATQDASNVARFLTFAATDGQTPGLANGQLPPGYLALTAANALQPLADAARTAATQIAPPPPTTTTTIASAPPTTVKKHSTTPSQPAPAPVATSVASETTAGELTATTIAEPSTSVTPSTTTPPTSIVPPAARPLVVPPQPDGVDAGTTTGRESRAGSGALGIIFLLGLLSLVAAGFAGILKPKQQRQAAT